MTEKNDAGSWRSKCSGVVERWAEARRRKYLTDVNFLVGEDEAVKFSAHKNVLSFGSPVFEAMLYGDDADTNDPIKISDVDGKTFEEILKFLYGELIRITSFHLSAKVYSAAEKYMILDLQSEIGDIICDLEMDEEQFWEIAFDDNVFQMPLVKRYCLYYISKRASYLLESYMFLSVSQSVIKDILDLEAIDIKEIDLLNAVVRWCINNSSSEFNVKAKLAPFLPYIRFATLTAKEFSDFLNLHPHLISTDSSLAILKYLLDPSGNKLPAWCSASNNKRRKFENK